MTARRSRPPVLAAGVVIAFGLALISLPVVAADPSTSPSASSAASAPPSTQPSGSPSASGLPLPTLPPRPPLPDGLLGIRARGSRRFRATHTRVRDNGLVHGEVSWLAEEPQLDMPPEYGLLALILERLLEQVGGEHARAERQRLDDASWVGFRLAELLPVELTERQHWLQLTDPLQRLDGLMRCIPRFQPD